MPVAAMALALPMAPASAAGESGVSCASASTGWRAPVEQRYVITSPFGMRVDPITHRRQLHAGVDLAMLPGAGPVVAADVGTVVHAGPYGGLGNEVTLQHADGVQTLYGHMARIDPSIRPGVQVAAGQVLGVEGSTGQSTGDHLHFEVLVNGKPVNPVPFMVQHGAPLTGSASTTAVSAGFVLPAAGKVRKDSINQPALSVPATIMDLYVAAGQKYGVPWPLLAGVGMEETGQGRNNHESSAGAQGLMQFLPATFARYSVDGNGDGKIDIHNDADSVYSAAHALSEFGVKDGAAGVRTALFSYNHAIWYVNDVLYYAASYAAGAGGIACTSTSDGSASPAQTAGVVAWARGQVGHAYRFGSDGPDTWDSSSFVQAAYAKIGVQIPRTAQAQRNWLASGHGVRVQPGQEKAGDLIFENSYLGPDKIGFVMLVSDPGSQRGIAARNPKLGVSYASYAGAAQSKHIFEIWRVNAPTGGSTRP
ncbi:peptidoglycan DD-metalloendopeptidase family protein [Leekyejoonella antrihumi]|uniref:peptidoglycan DD-metalloendopeptidase family protein n=1 Tax=Leekyejoonella antrihumi TaxID=1660198 RepID=UPI00164523C3|nr:peptidoglycan DD-metalloendopeptidase family protein [Leekyejoonella antrihumi]